MNKENLVTRPFRYPVEITLPPGEHLDIDGHDGILLISAVKGLAIAVSDNTDTKLSERSSKVLFYGEEAKILAEGEQPAVILITGFMK